MTENGVPITGNEPSGAFPTVPFGTFLWHKSHDDTYLNTKLECGPMPNVMAALPNIGGALCSTPQSLADAHY